MGQLRSSSVDDSGSEVSGDEWPEAELSGPVVVVCLLVAETADGGGDERCGGCTAGLARAGWG